MENAGQAQRPSNHRRWPRKSARRHQHALHRRQHRQTHRESLNLSRTKDGKRDFFIERLQSCNSRSNVIQLLGLAKRLSVKRWISARVTGQMAFPEAERFSCVLRPAALGSLRTWVFGQE